MKFPLSWLKEIIPTKLEKEKLINALMHMGIEVEGVYPTPTKDTIFEVAVTPNLSFAANLVGIARELQAYTGEFLARPVATVKEDPAHAIHDLISVEVEDSKGAPLYAGRVLLEVEVAPAPAWIRDRLEACGLRSVNNVVDITNYVMLECGQPMHAFDYEKLGVKKIVVRRARAGETLTAIDGKNYPLTPEALVIADGNAPIALAGIMGGVESEVSATTRKVFLEAAYFDPALVRKTSRRLGLHTEASRRFERNIDPEGVVGALDRAVELLQKYAHAKVARGTLEKRGAPFATREISCRLSRVNALLGTTLSLNEVEALLRRQGLSLVNTHEETLRFAIPSYRHDLHLEIDLIEEVARLYGLENIYQKGRAVFFQGTTLPHHPLYTFDKKSRQSLLGQGLQELLTCDLISPAEAELVVPAVFRGRDLVKILNPTSLDHSILRPSLLPNMLQVVKENAHHGIFDLAGFEVGKIHFKVKEQYLEPTAVALVLTGKKASHWETKDVFFDFFDLKGKVENFLAALHIDKVQFVASHFSNFHPHRQAKIVAGEIEVGILGEIHPQVLKNQGLANKVFYAEISLDDLFPLASQEIKMKPLPQFPPSMRDWTVTVAEDQPVGKILELIDAQNGEILEEVIVLDLYRSEQLGSESKNVTFRFIYRDPHQTVSFERVEREHERIINGVMPNL